MSLYIPKMSDTPGVTIPGLADNFSLLEGSLVEYGSNENGQYWRFSEGLQITRYYASDFPLVDPLPPGETVTIALNLPASFTNEPTIAVSGIPARPGWYIVPGILWGYARFSFETRIALYNLSSTHSVGLLKFLAVLAVGRYK